MFLKKLLLNTKNKFFDSVTLMTSIARKTLEQILSAFAAWIYNETSKQIKKISIYYLNRKLLHCPFRLKTKKSTWGP